MKRNLFRVFVLVLILSLALPLSVSARAENSRLAVEGDVTFTILHTNDFHGALEASGTSYGAARVAQKIVDVRTAVGADNVLLLDGGDMMQGTLLSNITKGEATINYYNTIGYDLSTLGNHEFDWGQAVLADRGLQATYPMVAANVVQKVSGSCDGWTKPVLTATDGTSTYTIEPYQILTVGTAPNEVKVGVIGVGSVETPFITIAEATAGLCFKDPYDSIAHYYDEVKAASDVMVVLSHNGWTDGGYGYGFTVYGDQTLAKKLNDGGKPVSLIIGGHSHTNIPAPFVYGATTVVQAYYNGRQVGRADFTYNTISKAVSINWSKLVVQVDCSTCTPPTVADPQYQPIVDLIASYTSDPDYQALINEPIGYTQVDLLRDYNGDNMMADFVQDALYNQLNHDADTANDIDMFFNNAGGLRSDWCYNGGAIAKTGCVSGLLPAPFLMTYGRMFEILPFGNQTVIGNMTGAQIVELVNQSATLFKGALPTAGARFKFYRYSDALPGPQPWAWGAYDIEVYNKITETWEALDPAKTYRVATNNFLAPAGQDGFVPFKYLKPDIYMPDMLDTVNEWVKANYATAETAYKGPDGDGTLDGRVTRNGGDTFTGSRSEIVPLTILHHNDSHGSLVDSGSRPGYTRLVTLIKQERAHNPLRTLMLSAGDNIQGDAMMKFYMTASMGYSVDGTPLAPALQINPLIKAFNVVGYDAMTLGNHEYNFGKDVFVSTLSDANFPILQANVVDDGRYGIAQANVLPYIEKTVGPEAIKVAILGIGNHRVTNYELPSNIPGLSFPNPIDTAAEMVPGLRATNDVVIALTHIGFTEDPSSVEVDTNVDTNLAKTVDGIDAIVGGHSHTSAINGFGPYKWLPTFVGAPDGTPVIIGQAYRYNNTLGQMVIGLLAQNTDLMSAPSYKVVSRTGRYLVVNQSGSSVTPEDPAMVSLIQPYVDLLTAYQNIVLGQTITPIDATLAYTQETNAANLQADSAVWKLKNEIEGLKIDFHLSGAMSNTLIAPTATELAPVTLKIADMYSSMPYENSLLVMEITGPQLKAILERGYRNYYYYKYVLPGHGGYSYYTTCLLDTNAGAKITYLDTSPMLPNGHNVISLEFNGQFVDFDDPAKTYNVSTVNYLAAGSCNFNDAGVSLWPLDSIVADTQFYVRDAVIDYIKDLTSGGAPINPQIEGRLQFLQFNNFLWMPTLFK